MRSFTLLALHRRLISEIRCILDQAPKGQATFAHEAYASAVLL